MDADKFYIPGKHYFLSHSVGAQPRSHEAALARGWTDPWRTDGADVWGPWFDALDRFRNGLAPLIGAHADDICPQLNVSSGVAKIMLGLPERPGRTKIVLTEDDFPTIGFALAQAERAGYELVFLPGGESLADPDAWAPAFQDDVQLVLATQVFSNTSVLSPYAEIAKRARERGVFTIFDVAQSAGAIPLQLNEWGVDFAVGTSLKYLCAGTGAAYLWASKEAAAQCKPMDVGWFSHAEPFELDIHHFKFAKGAMRFMGGTPSIAPFAGASAGQEILNAHGVDAIFEHNQGLLTRLFAGLPEEAFLSTTKEGARGSAALIKVRDYDSAAAALKEAGIIHDTRKGATRISVHLYNDDNDIDALVGVLRDFI